MTTQSVSTAAGQLPPLLQRVVDLSPRLWMAADRSPLFRHLVFRPASYGLLLGALVARRLGGPRTWDEYIRPFMRAFGRARTGPLAAYLKLDPQDMGDLGRLQDFEDRMWGVEGHWESRGKDEAVKVETACPYAAMIRRFDLPEFCTDVIHHFESATYEALNPSYTLAPLDGTLLSKGDGPCRFCHRLRTTS